MVVVEHCNQGHCHLVRVESDFSSNKINGKIQEAERTKPARRKLSNPTFQLLAGSGGRFSRLLMQTANLLKMPGHRFRTGAR